MRNRKNQRLVLPALRGVMGDWAFYSCLMSLRELSERVDYAEEVHKNKSLSDMIQRQLKGDRSSQISEYLQSQPERFFNSLVIATYRGEPEWHAIASVKQKGGGTDLNDLDAETVESLGFLTLSGDERLFALDGQHRLAGIKKAVSDGLTQQTADEVSVIFVAHEATKKGLERTRRLFTTLNKTARPVSKGDIIALDEDDVMAISCRHLIEETEFFSDDRIAFVASNNMPVKNTTSLTTIGNLYDILTILFTSSNWKYRATKAQLSRKRPNDDILKQYFEYASKYFQLMRNNFPELNSFFGSALPSVIVKKHRGTHGGSVLFRPIGLDIITRIVARLTKDLSLADAVSRVSHLPVSLSSAPYLGLMWDSGKRTITNANKATLREVLLYMLGDYSKFTDDTLLKRYRKDTGNDSARLPKQIT